MGSYCVYCHVKDGFVFYVGSGNVTRPFDITSRNLRWKAFAKDSIVEVRILEWFARKDDAYISEIEWISRLRPPANMQRTKTTETTYEKRKP
jgi:hypothetical protein